MHKLHGGGISRAIRRISVISAAIAEVSPTQNVNSAASAELPAGQFSGKYAKVANFVQIGIVGSHLGRIMHRIYI